MQELLDSWYERVKSQHPDVLAICQPRRYHSVPGYSNPKYHAGIMASRILTNSISPNVVMGRVIVLTCELLKYNVPTYFLDDAFIRAVASTELPADLLFSELKLPYPAMVFVLPKQFSLDYFGRDIPFLGANYVEKRTYVFPPTQSIPHPNFYDAENDGITFSACVAYTSFPVDYATTIHLDEKITARVDDKIFEHYEIDDPFLKHWVEQNRKEDEPTKEEDIKISNNYVALLSKLILVLNQWSYIKMGTCERPQKIKKGKIRDSLWTPNFIGRGYSRPVLPAGEKTGRTLATHFRRRHFTWQVCGPKVGIYARHRMPSDEMGNIDWAKAGPEASEAFRASHKRIWVELQLINPPEPQKDA